MRGSNTMKTGALALLVALPLAFACQPAEEGQQGMEEAGQEQGEMGPAASSTFTPMGGSNVSGDVQFTREGTTLTVEVMAQMGGPGDYPNHIHEGTCEEPGGVVVPLAAAEAAEPGIGEASSDVDVTQLEAGSSYVVIIHTQQGAPAACAEVPTSVLQ